MIKSMTGYGRAEGYVNGYNITVEMKSVNHRYFEFSCRVPRMYSFLEEKLKSYIASVVQRGKVDVFIMIEAKEAQSVEVEINHQLAAGYMQALKSIEDEYSLSSDITALSLARMPDVFTLNKPSVDEGEMWESIKSVASAAAGTFTAMQTAEGAKLRDDIKSRVENILGKVAEIEASADGSVKKYMDKLEARIKELLEGAAVDEQRLLTEAAIVADKTATAEETVRLKSHIEQLTGMLESAEPAGRKMDFIVQEMNREINTIGSKSQDIEVSRHVVDVKAEIEKIREQVQNIQ